MALYDDDDEDVQIPVQPPPAKARKVEEEPEQAVETPLAKPSPLQMKFFQQQIQRRHVAAPTQRPAVSPVVDLSAKKKPMGSFINSTTPVLNLKPPKPVRAVPLGDAPPLSFIPHSLIEDKVLLFGEYEVIDEYQPAVPTDYGLYKAKREEQRAREEAAREIAARLEREHKEEAKKRTMGAAIAPPTALLEEPKSEPMDQEDKEKMPPPSFVPPPAFGGGSRGLGVAASIMSKMGYKAGSGLGRSEQGMSTALHVEKIGNQTGKIIAEGARDKALGEGASSMSTAMLPPPSNPTPAPPATSMTEALKASTKILVLRNMVPPEEVDDELEAEIRDEMKKYGQVVDVVVHKVSNPSSEEEAVRIFVEFTNAAQAIKAYVDLNGRFFGGRPIRASFYDVDNFQSRVLNE